MNTFEHICTLMQQGRSVIDAYFGDGTKNRVGQKTKRAAARSKQTTPSKTNANTPVRRSPRARRNLSMGKPAVGGGINGRVVGGGIDGGIDGRVVGGGIDGGIDGGSVGGGIDGGLVGGGIDGGIDGGLVGGGIDGGTDGRVVGGGIDGGVVGGGVGVVLSPAVLCVVALLALLVCPQAGEAKAHPRPDHGQGSCACGRRN